MSQPNPSTAMARAVIDELVRCGVSLVAVSPGSRSAALAIAAAEHPGVELRVVLDERSAAFHALGRAKATGMPAAAVSTSGTAPTNWFPAVVEADLSLTPLVLLSADRPAELQGVGANQTIDQVRLFGSHVRRFEGFEAPDGEIDANGGWRARVSHAIGAACGAGSMPGPVHVNLRFREPTVPVADDGRSAAAEYRFPIEGRPDGGSWDPIELTPAPGVDLGVPPGSRGLIIAGDGAHDGRGLVETGDGLGWPILATAASGLRGPGVVAGYHHLLSDPVPERLIPEVVVAIGAIGPSARLEALVSSAQTRIRVDRWGRRIDPARNATVVLHADPVASLRTVAAGTTVGAWRDGWLEADSAVRSAIGSAFRRTAGLTGPSVAQALNEASWDCLVVASSLPIREVDAHLWKHGRVIANRGASGIDGLVSTALGAASARVRTLALSGDLSLFHDGNGFLVDVKDDLVIVVLDNAGGGLFDSLPLALHAPHYERLFVAPQDRDIEDLARFHRLGYARVSQVPELIEEANTRLRVGGTHLIHVPIDRDADLAIRVALDEAARSAMGSLQA